MIWTKCEWYHAGFFWESHLIMRKPQYITVHTIQYKWLHFIAQMGHVMFHINRAIVMLDYHLVYLSCGFFILKQKALRQLNHHNWLMTIQNKTDLKKGYWAAHLVWLPLWIRFNYNSYKTKWQMFTQYFNWTYFMSEVVSKNVFASLPQQSYRMNVVLECTEDMCAWLMVEADVLICEKLENCLALAQMPLMMSLSSLVGGSIVLRSPLSTPSACDIHTNLALTQTSHTRTVFLTQMHIEELLKMHHKLAWGTSQNLFCPVSPFYSMIIPVLLTLFRNAVVSYFLWMCEILNSNG